MNLSSSKTLQNLMRAFAGECQARSRYDFAASAAKNEKLPCIQRVFEYTAAQEYEHAELFFKHLRSAGVQSVNIAGGYPVDLQADTLSLLRDARHNELEEHHIVYPDFARIAREENFPEIAFLFENVARIEESHAERFAMLAKLLEQGKLFSNDGQNTRWVCLNCGNIFEAADAPALCPVCQHEQGYYVRESFAPYTRV